MHTSTQILGERPDSLLYTEVAMHGKPISQWQAMI